MNQALTIYLNFAEVTAPPTQRLGPLPIHEGSRGVGPAVGQEGSWPGVH